ncbi:MAG TPA: tyrosine-type recombinase/integrase [Actinomycetes bacterium]|nr:tyrosine-type recombinase/integrase [Actinomycetes bacterium]
MTSMLPPRTPATAYLGPGQLGCERQLDRDVHEGIPKTKAGTGRAVHSTTDTVAVLRQWKRQQAAEGLAWGEAYEVNDCVFVKENGQPYLPESLTQAFQRAAERAGVRVCRLHDLRHLSASLGHAAGESMLGISRRLGRSTPEFTAAVYTHLFEEEKVADASRRAVLLRPDPSAALPSQRSDA